MRGSDGCLVLLLAVLAGVGLAAGCLAAAYSIFYF